MNQEHVLSVVTSLAERLACPTTTHKLAQVANQQVGSALLRNSPRLWQPQSIAFGDTGVALFFAQMDRCFPQEGWDLVAHRFLKQLELFSPPSLSPALFHGLAGYGVTLTILSHHERYQHALETLDHALCAYLMQSLSPFHALASGIGFGDYDLISGPTGIGVYLLMRMHVPVVREALHFLLDHLITLSQWQSATTLGYFLPKRTVARYHPTYLAGCTNCGIAHGVAGPLSLLSLASGCGIVQEGLSEAIRQLALFLLRARTCDAWGINWPGIIPHMPSEAGMPPGYSNRATWCYGAPGIARALFLAGQALDDTSLQSCALSALEAVCRRPRSARRLITPVLCHGIAGLLHILVRSQRDLPGSFSQTILSLQETLLELFDPALPLGFQDKKKVGVEIDDPGFLTGAAGIALALLASATAVDPVWDRVLLLSGGPIQHETI